MFEYYGIDDAGGYYAFNTVMGTNNPNRATGMNYWINNTVNYPMGHSIGLQMDSQMGNWTFKNNITSANTVEYNIGTITSFAFDYNSYYSTNSWYFNDNGNGSTLSQWKTNHSTFDAHSNFGNPLFISANSSEISTNSPAYRAGTVVGGVTLDITKGPFAGTPSMGAFEVMRAKGLVSGARMQ